MTNYTNYFNRIAYKPRYQIGDRVFGYWNQIPFIGTVANDSAGNELTGPCVSVCTDLPIVHKNKVHNVVFVKPKGLQRLKVY